MEVLIKNLQRAIKIEKSIYVSNFFKKIPIHIVYYLLFIKKFCIFPKGERKK
ncbi:MAG: hypothetical protein DDT31_01154 [Syntrophomonadaceae bacterium]|nr:hypothetical protein [Bacillota bacterium]